MAVDGAIRGTFVESCAADRASVKRHPFRGGGSARGVCLTTRNMRGTATTEESDGWRTVEESGGVSISLVATVAVHCPTGAIYEPGSAERHRRHFRPGCRS